MRSCDGTEGDPKPRVIDPLRIPKCARRFPGFDDKIIAVYAPGMSTRDIQARIGQRRRW
jgi:transposase-like protein